MLVEVHPAADAFPMMNAEQYEGLKADIDERAAKLATLKNGEIGNGRKVAPSNDEPTRRDDAAKLLNVSTASVDRAKHVVANGSKELVQAVERGDVNLNQATKLVKAVEDKREQAKIIREGKEAIKAVVQLPKEAPPKPVPTDEPDDYDYTVVKAFEHADYRLNTLKRILDGLKPHERQVAVDWLNN